MDTIEKSIKNLFLAAVGGTALSYEKAEEVVNKMVDKGKVSVEQGKSLTEDLTRTIKGTKQDEVVDTESSKMELAEELLALRLDVNELTKTVEELRQRLDKESQSDDN